MIKQLAIGSILIASATSYLHAEEKKTLIQTDKGSMIMFGCVNCEPEKPEVEEIVLEQGSQVLDVRKVGDDLKIYRTENWLGGSPVSYVHMPSNPDDKRFSALEEGPLDMTPLPKELDGVSVASIDNDNALDTEVVGPKKPDLDQGIAEDVAVIENTTDVEPVIASAEGDAKTFAEKPEDVDAEAFELRLN